MYYGPPPVSTLGVVRGSFRVKITHRVSFIFIFSSPFLFTFFSFTLSIISRFSFCTIFSGGNYLYSPPYSPLTLPLLSSLLFFLLSFTPYSPLLPCSPFTPLSYSLHYSPYSSSCFHLSLINIFDSFPSVITSDFCAYFSCPEFSRESDIWILIVVKIRDGDSEQSCQGAIYWEHLYHQAPE